MIECLPLSGIDLECVDGEWRTFHGCSLEGLFEFQERRLELFQLCGESEKSVWELYRASSRFKFLINRCLMLNGVKPAWVSIHQIEQLLFVRETAEGLRLGALIELNTPPKTDTPSPDTVPTLEESIALLAMQCSGIQEALELARTEPAKKLLGIVGAKAELSKPPEEKRQQGLKDFAKAERAKARGGD